MLGVLYLERDPLKLADLATGLMTWVQVVGSVAAICLLVWLPIHYLNPGPSKPGTRSWLPRVFGALILGALLGYVALLALRLPDLIAGSGEDGEQASPQRLFYANIAFTIGAGCALLAVCLPFFINMLDMSWRRIFAVAKLSFKEAVRRRILYVFCVFILVLLFVQWFVQAKPESQLQSYVEIVFRTMTPLLLVSAALVACMSIPNDIKQQTIHTIVTKPVERFEIVFGRVLGYTALMSLVLVVLTTLSLFYVLRGINPLAANQSLKARDPLYGNLSFVRIENEYGEEPTPEKVALVAGGDVGREWEYHKYINGQSEANPKEPVMYAVWAFRDLPASLGDRETVRCEFSFDIYRSFKGKENRDILCSFFFQTPGYRKSRENYDAYLKERAAKGSGVGLTPEVDNPLSEKYGYFEVQGKGVRNYHTLHVDVPGGVFKNALKAAKDLPPDAPQLLVRVRCGSEGQMVGMARYDLYLRGDDAKSSSDTTAFALNFFKGALGLWMRLILVVTLSVCVSTQLGGIISFLLVMLLILGGESRDFIKDLATKSAPGGGPAESFFRLVGRKVLAAELDDNTTTRVARSADDVFSFMMKMVLEILPDMTRWNYTERVGNGFNIGVISQDLLPSFLMLLGYLAPWLLLAFYLIRSREIAGAH